MARFISTQVTDYKGRITKPGVEVETDCPNVTKALTGHPCWKLVEEKKAPAKRKAAPKKDAESLV